jgi:hypothetical protein
LNCALGATGPGFLGTLSLAAFTFVEGDAVLLGVALALPLALDGVGLAARIVRLGAILDD